MILGELTTHDPDGNWTNRPLIHWISIMLPWLPQTLAPFEKRQVVVAALRREVPKVAWDLLLQMLPNQHTSSKHTSKPIWRNPLPNDHQYGVTHLEYWEQVDFYAGQAIAMAVTDTQKLVEIVVDRIDDLPQSVLQELIDVLSSDLIMAPSERALRLLGKSCEDNDQAQAFFG